MCNLRTGIWAAASRAVALVTEEDSSEKSESEADGEEGDPLVEDLLLEETIFVHSLHLPNVVHGMPAGDEDEQDRDQ